MRDRGYYWVKLKFRNYEEWYILYWNSTEKSFVYKDEFINELSDCKILEIDEKQIKRE